MRWSLLDEMRKTLAIGIPIILGMASQIILGVTDLIMLSYLGTSELAAAAFTNTLSCIPIALAAGLSIAVSVQVSHKYGARCYTGAGETLMHGMATSVATAFFLAALIAGTVQFLEFFRQPHEVTSIVPPYLFWIALSMIPLFPSGIIKSFAEAHGVLWGFQWVLSLVILLNVFLNYIFIFGNFGVSSLGLTGAGIATFLSRLILFLAFWIYASQHAKLEDSWPSRWLFKPNWTEVVSQFRIAGPVTGHLLILLGAFSFSSLLIGSFGSVPLAAHQIVLTCVGSSFMVPLGLSLALTIRVGHCVGAGEKEKCKMVVLGGLIMAQTFTIFCSVVYCVFSISIPSLFTIDPLVINIASKMLIVASVYHFFESLQIMSVGALRGVRDVLIPAIAILLSFWFLGIPLGSILSFKISLGPIGIWIGTAIGMASTAVVLLLRLFKKQLI